jgi:hypothetical protein
VQHQEEPSNSARSLDPIHQDASNRLANSCSSESLEKPPDSTIPPCKLLSILAGNPRADITQIPLPPNSDRTTCVSNEDGVECSRAYKMLIHYATSEEKMDDIAKALEDGCTPMKGGGCKVKSSTILSTLDKVI